MSDTAAIRDMTVALHTIRALCDELDETRARRNATQAALARLIASAEQYARRDSTQRTYAWFVAEIAAARELLWGAK